MRIPHLKSLKSMVWCEAIASKILILIFRDMESISLPSLWYKRFHEGMTPLRAGCHACVAPRYRELGQRKIKISQDFHNIFETYVIQNTKFAEFDNRIP